MHTLLALLQVMMSGSQIFPRADLPSFRVLQNPPSVPKSILLIDQDVAYYRDPKGEPTKVCDHASSAVANFDLELLYRRLTRS